MISGAFYWIIYLQMNEFYKFNFNLKLIINILMEKSVE
jgi:hypothetical protein